MLERNDWGFLAESKKRKVWSNLLLWQGTRDSAVHPESANYLVNLLPGARLTTLEGYNHDDVMRKDWKKILRKLIYKAAIMQATSAAPHVEWERTPGTPEERKAAVLRRMAGPACEV